MANVEIKIKNLENEIARLKSENALQNRLEHIQNMAVKRDLSREEEINALTHKYTDLKMSIDELLPRIVNMFKVAKCLKDNGYCASSWYYNRIKLHDNETWGKSISCYLDSSNLYLGFVNVKLFFNNEIEDWDLTVETWFYEMLDKEEGHRHEWKVERATNMLCAMETFLENFDKFEENFYEYAENPKPKN